MPDLFLGHLPQLPRRRDWRIGCAGAGFIMADCHLVAYRNAGFNPVAIASRNPATAREVAAPAAPGSGIFGFARGARAGQCLHALLERPTEAAFASAEMTASWANVHAATAVRLAISSPI